MVNMQREILDAYEQANRAWLARVKSEVEFWSELASKLSATRSVPEAMRLPAERGAAHANGDRGRATTDRGLPKDYAEVRRIDIQWVADEKHRERTAQPCRSGARGLHPRNERNSDGRAQPMGDATWNRPATTM